MSPELIEEEAALQSELAPEPVDDIQETIEEQPAGTIFTQTIDDIPELANRQPGELISFRIQDVSPDGVFQLAFMPNDGAPEGFSQGPAPVGPEEQDILNQLAGGQ